MSTLTYTGELTILSCFCGIKFAVPEQLFIEHKRRWATDIYCPLGHRPRYGSRSVESELADEKARAERIRRNLEDEREMHRRTERRLNATRGVVTRTKKRISGGVCPCCNRTFVGLARHMSAQHPDYLERVEAG